MEKRSVIGGVFRRTAADALFCPQTD